jgi:hypothetical protein
MRPGIAFVVLALGLASCGGGDSTSTVTVSVVTQPTATITTQSTPPRSTTTTSATTPEPGTGSGAANALMAAAAVLTDGGTTKQACGSYVTERFIETSYGGEANCVAARKHVALARSIVVGPRDDAHSTRFVVVPKGGPYDGAKVTVDLVEQDGAYRVDALKAHVPAGP